jgi:hypothetical protein
MTPLRPDRHAPPLTADEQELIAFHLGEPCDSRSIHARLERDAAFAALSEEIAHTLRVFSADPIPAPDVDAAWQHLRGTLPPFQSRPGQVRLVPRFPMFGRGWFAGALAGALCLLLLAFGLVAHHRRPTPTEDTAGVIHLRPPVNTTPAGEADHLDRAERWLTEVNHSTEPLGASTRAQGEQLLTENAVYLRDARARGDLPDSAVLDHLDRVLTAANHPAEAGLSLRVDMNTDGLLFELRILRQNQTASTGDTQ